MEFITCIISFPDCGLFEKSEAAVEFYKSKKKKKKKIAAVIQQHIILHLVTT
jgi:hypothetical protein